MNILLIEPDILLARVYKEALSRAGHRVTVVGGAQQAVQQADKLIPDVVVAELQLAGHNSVEFLHEFRSYPEWDTVPVILHTVIQPQKLIAVSKVLDLMGVNDILYKPATTMAQLIRAIENTTRVTAL